MSALFLLFTFCAFGKVFSDCRIVTKKEWDGLKPNHVEYMARPVNLVIIQHSATLTCTTNDTCTSIVRNIQTNHMDSLGYWDIGPSFLVGGNGLVYEGSGWIHVGAHTFGYNRRSIGITFIGNFNTDEPAPAALQAIKDLLQCGVDKGHLKPNYSLVGHKQLIATESPGRKLYNEIKKWPHYLANADLIKDKQ